MYFFCFFLFTFKKVGFLPDTADKQNRSFNTNICFVSRKQTFYDSIPINRQNIDKKITIRHYILYFLSFFESLVLGCFSY